MAEWGKGDSRWIVEERPDATNVNNWHWTEKKYTGFAKRELSELLVDKELIATDKGFKCVVNKLEIEGDSYANNRKGKVILSFDQEITMEYKATKDGCDVEYTGKIKIPNFDDVNGSEDIDINVTIDKEDEDGRCVKTELRKKGAKEIKKRFAIYLVKFRNDAIESCVLPTAKQNNGTTTKAATANPAEVPKPSTHATTVTATAKTQTIDKTINDNKDQKSNSNIGAKINTKTYKKEVDFKCTALDAFMVFTDPQRVQAWARSPVKMENFKGGNFEIFGKQVEGTFVQFESPKMIEMSWRRACWCSGYYSNVTIEFKQGSDSTTVSLVHKGIPEDNYEATCEGWIKMYFANINSIFGYVASLPSTF